MTLDAGTPPCGCVGGIGNQCQAGDSPLACGNTGGACQRCGNGQQCVSGSCVTAACGPGTCSGCCARGICSPASMQTSFTCGSGGAMCSQCPRGQQCVNGACQAQACDSVSCATGCCAIGRCLEPRNQSQFTCGTLGAMCSPCPGGGACRGGMCVPPTTLPDGGVPGLPAGSACTGSACGAGFCIEESQFGFNTGFPGGYCVATCGAGQPPCTSGVCVTEAIFGQPGSTCRATCPAPGGGQSTCRAGYVCAPTNTSSVPTGFCRPNCNNGNLAACPSGTTCQANGFCT